MQDTGSDRLSKVFGFGSGTETKLRSFVLSLEPRLSKIFGFESGTETKLRSLVLSLEPRLSKIFGFESGTETKLRSLDCFQFSVTSLHTTSGQKLETEKV